MCILKSVRLAGLNFDPMSMWECVNFSFLASGLHCRVVSSVLSRLLRDVRRFEPDGDSKFMRFSWVSYFHCSGKSVHTYGYSYSGIGITELTYVLTLVVVQRRT